MKALVLTEKEKMSIQEVERPTIQPHEVLVKVKVCGICGTDVHIFHGEPGSSEVNPPIVLGHEFSGEVVTLGEAVTGLQKGDHVAADPNLYCGKCTYCRQGRVQLCDDLSAIGVTRNGGMAEYCAVPEKACFKLSKDLSFQTGAMVEPLSCVLHGFEQLPDIKPHTTVLIIGGGFIGSLFLQTVQLKSPAKVTVCELVEAKHTNLKALGADEVYTDVTDIEETFDIVIECVGKQQTSETAVTRAAKGGNVLLFGVPSPTTTLSLPAYDIFSKELTISGSFINPYTVEDAVEYLSAEKVKVNSLFSHVLSLEDVPSLLQDYAANGVTKAIIDLEK